VARSTQERGKKSRYADLPEEERLEMKRADNRVSARKYRGNLKETREHLQQENQKLYEENQNLKVRFDNKKYFLHQSTSHTFIFTNLERTQCKN
jgi:dynactin complex subunit